TPPERTVIARRTSTKQSRDARLAPPEHTVIARRTSTKQSRGARLAPPEHTVIARRTSTKQSRDARQASFLTAPAQLSGIQRSNPLKISLPLPVRHRKVVSILLRPEEVRVVLDHVFPEHALRELARSELFRRLAERIRHPREIARRIHVAAEMLRRLDLVFDAVEPGRERRGECQIRIHVGTRNPALDAQRRARADDTKSRRAIVVAPREPRRRPRTVDVTLVRIHRRRIEHHHVRHVPDPA